MIQKFLQKISIVTFAVLVLSACAAVEKPVVIPTIAPTPTPQVTQMTRREAQVQSVEVQRMGTNPVQLNAVVRGNLTEACATLGESQVQYASNAFRITVYVLSPANRGCAQVTSPFETTVPLNTTDLPAGSYSVIANGVSTVFTLPIEHTTPSPVPTAATGNQACTDSAAFVADVTVPDNTVFESDTAFTKTWRLKNTGTCTWNNDYLVAYISGATMTQQPGYWIVAQGQTVAPGQMVDISVGMTSPAESGSYASYWGLKKADGQFMPIQGGANGNSFYVKLMVDNGSDDSGNVTAASIDIEPEQGSGPACSADSTYLVHASLTADGPITVAYEIDSTAGQIPAGNFQVSPLGPAMPSVTGTLVFEQATTKTIDLRFVGPYPYPSDITVLLWVNHGEWYSGKLSCQ